MSDRTIPLSVKNNQDHGRDSNLVPPEIQSVTDKSNCLFCSVDTESGTRDENNGL
jgi:hypothetical protein